MCVVFSRALLLQGATLRPRSHRTCRCSQMLQAKMEHIVACWSVHTALPARSKDLCANLHANLLTRPVRTGPYLSLCGLGCPVVCPWQDPYASLETWFLGSSILSNFRVQKKKQLFSFTSKKMLLTFSSMSCGWSKAPHNATKHSSFCFAFGNPTQFTGERKQRKKCFHALHKTAVIIIAKYFMIPRKCHFELCGCHCRHFVQRTARLQAQSSLQLWNQNLPSLCQEWLITALRQQKVSGLVSLGVFARQHSKRNFTSSQINKIWSLYVCCSTQQTTCFFHLLRYKNIVGNLSHIKLLIATFQFAPWFLSKESAIL